MFFPFKLAAKIMGMCFSAIVLYFVVTGVQVYLTGAKPDLLPTKAIVVMGTAQLNGVPSEDLAARLTGALDLYHRGFAPIVAVTGGRKAGDVYTEAGVSRNWLVSHGVPNSSIIGAGGSNSYENLTLLAPKLKRAGVTSTLMVTDAFHEMRSMAIASSLGFAPHSAPISDSPIKGMAQLPYYAKEALEIGVARFVGYGRLSSMSGR
ncbi:MAG: YdcF family protein [Actinobacteria bacterium]|nr:YdcF family protein [Actinomycetota bacterium]